MSRVAKYKKIEHKKIKHVETYEKNLKEYVFQRKIYNASNAEIIEMIFSKELTSKTHLFRGDDRIKFFDNLIRKVYERNIEDFLLTLKNMLLHIAKVSETFFVEGDNLKILTTIAQLKSDFLRPIEAWKPKSRNRFKQIFELLRHLFAKFEVPEFLDKGFINAEIDSVTLFLNIGKGESFKKFELAPEIVLNKKIYHFILSTPANFTFFEAFRRAQILSMGGSEKLVSNILASRLRNIQKRTTLAEKLNGGNKEEFWATVIQFFIAQPMFDYDHVTQIIDYIEHKKFNYEVIRGVTVPPEQPNFTIKGRTIQALLRQTEEWHQHLARTTTKYRNNVRTWKGVPIADFEINLTTGNKYQIVQLTTQSELTAEGSDMRHCVASYAHSCANGNTSIWSLRHVTNHGISYKRMVTVELENRIKQIVQIRGKNNRKAEQFELNILQHWVAKEGLSFSRYA